MYEKTHSKAIQERVVEDYISDSLRNFGTLANFRGIM